MPRPGPGDLPLALRLTEGLGTGLIWRRLRMQPRHRTPKATEHGRPCVSAAELAEAWRARLLATAHAAARKGKRLCAPAQCQPEARAFVLTAP